MKTYTKTGDAGETGLFGGGRVRKDHPRVAAYGAVDELNAALGLARALGVDNSNESENENENEDELDERLDRIQGELFTLGADLATPFDKLPGRLTRMDDKAVAALEREIDAMETELEPLRSFILPGGSPGGAALHLARTVCRRAEREIAALAAREPVNDACLRYVNRLSDWLFAAARWANARAGCSERVWA